MSAFEEFVTVIKDTEAVKDLLRNLETEPAKLLEDICKEYELTNKIVPDHHIYLAGYFSDVMLRALIAAGLIAKEPGGIFSIWAYKPTELGIKHYKAMLDEKKTQ